MKVEIVLKENKKWNERKKSLFQIRDGQVDCLVA